MKELLIKLDACDPAMEWVGDKSWEEVYNTCHRGDWLLWLHNRTNQEDLQIRTLSKGHCANTVRHLMKNERSLKAVSAAIAFGEGRATKDELSATALAIYEAYAAYATRVKNQKETANIVRKYIPIELWNTQKMIDELKIEKEVNNGN